MLIDMVYNVILESWYILTDASVYILMGLFAAGLIKVFIHPESIARHLGTGRISPVFKAAVIGIPLPL